LIEGLYAAGIRKTIATPHIIGDLYRNTPATINNALLQVKTACTKKNIDIEITAAAEYMLDDHFMELLRGDAPLLTLHKNIILTEIAYSSSPENLEEIILAITTKGYKPILAHPERYNFFQQKFEYYSLLTEMGFILQINLLSLTGYYGKKAAKAAKFILDNNLCKLVGTDLHHKRHLAAVNLPENREIFHEYLGGKTWNNLDALAK
jgi:protein-tyrosine phosphatase